MYSVRDLTRLPELSGVNAIVAPDSAYRRVVKEIAVLDVEPLTGEYEVFHPGDAVFSSLGFSGGSSAAIDDALLHLIDLNVAGIFIKNVLPYEASDDVIAASRKTGVPVFRYDKGVLERIISNVRSLIAEDAQADLTEESLRTLLHMRSDCGVRRQFAGISGLEGSIVQAFALSVTDEDPLVLSALKAQLDHGLSPVLSSFTARFGKSILGFVAADDLMPLQKRDIEALIAGFGTRPFAGLSEAMGVDFVDTAINEAMGCCEAAKDRGVSVVAWNEAGPATFHIAAREGRLLNRACAAGLTRLMEVDEETGSDLMESMRIYVDCGGDTTLAAKRLCQHPNSMRNRVNRARKALSLEEATDKQLFAYLAMLYL